MNTDQIKKIKRFSPVLCLFHLILLLTFLFQSATGIARLSVETAWGRRLCNFFGGYESTFTLHKYVGILMLVVFFFHLIYLFSKVKWRKPAESILGPDSIFPRLKDFSEFFQHVGWFLGLTEHPKFDRWTYWEKFDYWAVFWGMIILSSTGLVLSFQIFATRYIPGWGLNIALWLHRIEALLAMAHVFIIHFLIAHFRRHNFPMDRVIFDGNTSLETLRHEKISWIERLENTNRLNQLIAKEPTTSQKIISYVVGYTAMAIGVFLLIGGIMNLADITW